MYCIAVFVLFTLYKNMNYALVYIIIIIMFIYLWFN